MEVPVTSLPCIPGYTWDDVAWLGNDGYPNYYVTRDGKVYNDKTGVWVKPDRYGSATLSYEPSKFRHVNIRKMAVKYFLIPDMKKQGYVELFDGELLINREGKVYNTVLCQEPAQYIGNHGYIVVSYNKSHLLLHRLLATAFVPNDQPILRNYINHKDGNKLNNAIDNLEWVTPAENNRHASVTGALGYAKLSYEDSKHIRHLYMDEGYTISQLAREYGVARNTISATVHGHNWDYGADYKKDEDCKNVFRAAEAQALEHLPTREEIASDPQKYAKPEISIVDNSCYNTKQELVAADFAETRVPNIFVNSEGKIYDMTRKSFREYNFDPSSRSTRIKVRGRKYSVPRLIAEAFVTNDDPENKTVVLYLNEDQTDNRACNLIWASHAQKFDRHIKEGRAGDKLNMELATEIRNLYASGWTLKDIAEKYNVGKDAVHNVVHGLSWVE